MRIAGEREIAREDEHDAGVGQRERGQDAPGDPLLEQNRRKHDDERRIEVEHEPLERRGHVLQAHEIDQARDVVADETEPEDVQPVAPRDRSRCAASSPTSAISAKNGAE